MKPVLILCALLLAPAPVALAQDAGGTYVNIGEYTGDGFAPADAPVATVPIETYAVVPVPIYEVAPVQVAPVQVAPVPDPYVAPPLYSDAPVYSDTVVYSDTPVYSDTVAYDAPLHSDAQTYFGAQDMPAPVAALPYQPPFGIAGSGFAADGAYEAARLAAYDTNRDGTVTTAEAIATLRPLAGQ